MKPVSTKCYKWKWIKFIANTKQQKETILRHIDNVLWINDLHCNCDWWILPGYRTWLHQLLCPGLPGKDSCFQYPRFHSAFHACPLSPKDRIWDIIIYKYICDHQFTAWKRPSLMFILRNDCWNLNIFLLCIVYLTCRMLWPTYSIIISSAAIGSSANSPQSWIRLLPKRSLFLRNCEEGNIFVLHVDHIEKCKTGLLWTLKAHSHQER